MIDNIRSAVYKLLPTGTCWPQETEDTSLKKLVYGIADAFNDVMVTIDEVMSSLYPGQSGIFLQDWETLLNLPKCGQTEQELQDRINQVLAMFRLSPYSNAEFFEAIADVFGYTIVILAPTVGEPFRINIEVPGTVTYFKADESVAGDPLVVDTVDTSLKCLLDFFKLAHTHIVYT